MPRYDYQCRECGVEFTARHNMGERLEDCTECGSIGSLKFLPTLFATRISKANKTQKAGEVVKQHIEEARKEVENEKEQMKKDYLT